MSLNWAIVLTAVSSYLFGYLNRLYSIFFYSIKINSLTVAEKLYNHLKKNSAWKFTSNESYEFNPDSLPNEEAAFYWLSIPFFLNISQKYVTAGGVASETHTYIYTLRFFKKRIINLLNELNKVEVGRNYIDVCLNIDFTSYRVTNQIKKEKIIGKTVLPPKTLKEIEGVFEDVIAGRREKSGIIMHSSPGQGKSSIVKEMAAKYDADIYIPIFQHSHTNKDIVALFDNIPKGNLGRPIVVLLEDFDAIFNGRQNLLNDCHFSLDVILNVLDGAYLDMSNKIFIITCNDLSKIDIALKNRPSRFDLIVNIESPNYDLRVKILELGGLNGLARDVAKLTDGCSGAVLKEISKRRLHPNSLTCQIREIIESFGVETRLTDILAKSEDSNVPRVGTLITESPNKVC